MKVLQLGKFYPINGGVEKVMLDLTRGLSGKGIPCDMLCTSSEYSSKTIIHKISSNSQIICTPTLLKKYATTISPRMIMVLRRICKDYDIIHVHHPDPMAALALLLSGYKGKVVLHWHSDIVKQHFLLKLYMPLQNWLINRADIIVGTTPVYVEQSPHLKHARHKLTSLPIGIEPVKPNPLAVEKIRQFYHGKKIIFSLGRLVEYKGFRYLIDAASMLPDDCVVLIGGSGPLYQELEAQIERLHLQDKVFLLGRLSDKDLPNYYGACDLYCLSSIYKTEAFAIVQIEAMSCGKPVVATKIPGSGVDWVNKDGVSGLNVPPCQAQALSTTINTLLTDRLLYNKLSSGAKARFEEHFTEETMLDRCISIYRSLFKL
ncbi:MAG: glycosyltransferase [Prevotella sp.]|jgi:glycosyltransferase involved in cell wall biosynthesis